jgi:hypothetical protein
MSKKNLLSEATIRRFMKLADMEPLAGTFVDRLDEMHCPSGDRDDDMEPMEEGDLDERAKYGGNKGDESRSRRDYMEEGEYGGNKGDESRSRRDYMEEADDAEKLDATEDELSDMDAEADRERDEMDDMEDEMDAMDDGDIPADIRDRIEDALAGALEDLAGKLGLDMDVEREDDEPEMEVDVDAEVDLDVPSDDAEVEVDAEEEELLEGVEVVDDADLINEVAKRVTARLVKAMAKK